MAGGQVAEQGTQTRSRILTTAARLFSERGYEHTPLSQVAREAAVSKALVLWYFESKEELFRAAIGQTLEPYYIDVEDLAGQNPGQQIERLIDLFYEFVRDNLYSVRFLMGLLVRNEKGPGSAKERIAELYSLFRRLLADTIQRGRDEGVFRSDAQPDLDAALLLAGLAGILVENFLRNEDLPRQAPALLAHLKRTALARLLC